MSLARRLNTVFEKGSLAISGVGGTLIEESNRRTQLFLHLPNASTPLPITAHCLKRLGLVTPASDVDELFVDTWHFLDLADPSFNRSATVYLLIGADPGSRLLLPGVITQDDTAAQQTAVGWTITSRAPCRSSARTATSCPMIQDELTPTWHDLLASSIQRFWEQEDLPHVHVISPDDAECERSFSKHRRDSEGRYVIRLPVRPERIQLLGESLTIAQSSLNALHRRMRRDPDLSREYTAFMNKYQELGHIRPVSAPNPSNTGSVLNYIPHHGIWQRGSQGQKLRVVFHASRPTSSGYCLNDVLHTGPKLQVSLPNILIRWRRHAFAIAADMQTMFRQIRVDDRDVDLQRIIWSPDDKESPTHYQLSTVTYGQSCSPYLALRTVRQLCEDEGATRPLAAQALLEDTYTDDILSGGDNLDCVIELQRQLMDLMQAGGFSLGKWVANDPNLLSNIPEEDRLRSTWLQFKAEGPVSELGVKWNAATDSFNLTFLCTSFERITKRRVLSNIAKLFDPCGWMAPVLVAAKMIMQDIWREKVDWDETLPPALAERWKDSANGLQEISEISVRRWIHWKGNNEVQLHAFSDASCRAMAAVVYIRIPTSDTTACVSLLAAKTKLNSIKGLKINSTRTTRMTIPRLELRAALLTARLLRSVADALKLSSENWFIWSDSQIVIHWLHSHKPLGNALVDNYVVHIHEVLPNQRWRYVPSSSNPADIASRGSHPSVLRIQSLWWQGPPWLVHHQGIWPSEPKFQQIEPAALQPTVACY